MYFLYLRRAASRPWKLKIDKDHNPPITVIIPAHNEEKTIWFKLENLNSVSYPKEKMQIILADDASTDSTVRIASEFLSLHPELHVKVLKETERRGKSRILNIALKHAKNEIVVMSDADAFWASDILTTTLPYLADPTVGAVIGRQRILNSKHSRVTQNEEMYLNLMFEVVRLGESKLDSTIFFHGSFAAYKRSVLVEFNLEADDSGTALDIVQRGARTIFIPEAACFDVSPVSWKALVSTKLRRASQLVQIQIRCLKLLFRNQLRLSKRIALSEIFLYVFDPVIFLLIVVTTVFVILESYQYFLVLGLAVLASIIVPRSRFLLTQAVQNNCILLGALLALVLRSRFIIWNTLQEPRAFLTRDMLEKENLL